MKREKLTLGAAAIMAAAKGLSAHAMAVVANRLTPGTDWRKCPKGDIAAGLARGGHEHRPHTAEDFRGVLHPLPKKRERPKPLCLSRLQQLDGGCKDPVVDGIIEKMAEEAESKSHTPGPWYLLRWKPTVRSKTRVLVTSHPKDCEVANCGEVSERTLRNALLMSAAPDMLAALKLAAAWIETAGHDGKIDPTLSTIRAAVFKATEEGPRE